MRKELTDGVSSKESQEEVCALQEGASALNKASIELEDLCNTSLLDSHLTLESIDEQIALLQPDVASDLYLQRDELELNTQSMLRMLLEAKQSIASMRVDLNKSIT